MIFFFSGTGNSKWAAGVLAQKISDKLIPVADAVANNDFSYNLKDGESIGFVFPVHSWGPPPVVVGFMKHLSISGVLPSTYIYMLCTCGDDIGLTEKLWAEALPGNLRPSAAFSLQMPNTYIVLPGFDVDTPEVATGKLNAAEKRIEEIASDIESRKVVSETVKGGLPWLKSKIIYPLFCRFMISDKKFTVDHNACLSCGRCEAVCPVGNITCAGGIPQWNGNCTSCLACLHVCSARAIQYGKITKSKGRYFHK